MSVVNTCVAAVRETIVVRGGRISMRVPEEFHARSVEVVMMPSELSESFQRPDAPSDRSSLVEFLRGVSYQLPEGWRMDREDCK